MSCNKNRKLQKSKQKPTSKPPENPPETQASPSTTDLEKFQVELYWCIRELEKALASPNLPKKQVHEYTKSLTILMSNTSPMIKKRQVMRMALGDYRGKMAAEEMKFSKSANNIKLKPAITNQNTKFLKKSVSSSKIDNCFRFNFNIDELNEQNSTNQTTEQNPTNNSKEFHFVPSNNSFKFNFNVENNCD